MKAWPDNYECTGQTSIFDFIQDNSEPEILLHPGEHVWKVILGDIFEYEVEDWTYLCGENDRGYGLIDLENSTENLHTYSRAWNSSIDVDTFRTIEEAHIQAAKNLKVYTHILSSDMKPKKVVAYKTEYRGFENVNWYADLGDGLIYFKYGSLYDHIGLKDEIEQFEKKLYENKGNISWYEPVKLEDYNPDFKNMYRCNNKDWIYAGARFFGS